MKQRQLWTHRGSWAVALVLSGVALNGCEDTRAENSREEGLLPADRARALQRAHEDALDYLPATLLKSQEVAKASCERALRCGQIGPGKPHASKEACVAKFADGSNSNWCATEIDPVKLRVCVKAIEDEDCGAAVGAVDRLGVCEEGHLCRPSRK